MLAAITLKRKVSPLKLASRETMLQNGNNFSTNFVTKFKVNNQLCWIIALERFSIDKRVNIWMSLNIFQRTIKKFYYILNDVLLLLSSSFFFLPCIFVFFVFYRVSLLHHTGLGVGNFTSEKLIFRRNFRREFIIATKTIEIPKKRTRILNKLCLFTHKCVYLLNHENVCLRIMDWKFQYLKYSHLILWFFDLHFPPNFHPVEIYYFRKKKERRVGILKFKFFQRAYLKIISCLCSKVKKFQQPWSEIISKNLNLFFCNIGLKIFPICLIFQYNQKNLPLCFFFK